MTERAQQTGRPQRAVYNGVELEAKPGDTAQSVLRKYREAER
ncbi:MAG TPA: hypothetical protein VEU33_39545 [Archangium sp.]|nr:hypothetical protein [Archangium sp.]